ncbi:TetR/AcrR family transcriptional regulator [Labedaea rhizosphaerae]|uniref:TetR family transcriptional regulator n=1 Tax=Labedaea rhizosphaerae TaxID=598644 RepID=A0A4R6SCH0_LABRH|nr:TetR/AcrR family transcriptional regulator [Labedaea rhizosphaerae]TDP97779.1 TetR family transcriptional regulator [Labedaea rhizosphaerae]
MGRPPAHSADEFVDAAVRLFASGGARAVTMTSVARELGVHSGSVYYRFPDRPSLLSAMWLRTERRFNDELLRLVDEHPGAEGVVLVSGWIVDWCRDNVEQAAVLHAGVRAFSPHTWPQQARTELAEHSAARDRQTARVVRAVGAETGRDADEILLALIDLPISVVSRYLARGTAPPPSATKLTRRIAKLIMAG